MYITRRETYYRRPKIHRPNIAMDVHNGKKHVFNIRLAKRLGLNEMLNPGTRKLLGQNAYHFVFGFFGAYLSVVSVTQCELNDQFTLVSYYSAATAHSHRVAALYELPSSERWPVTRIPVTTNFLVFNRLACDLYCVLGIAFVVAARIFEFQFRVTFLKQ